MAHRGQQNSIATKTRTIDDFKQRLIGGGSRSNLFEVVMNFPEGVVGADVTDIELKSRFLIKAAQLPASNVTPIEVPFRGRTLKVAGDRTFDAWTVTVINDTDFALRSSFERWMNFINKVSDASGRTSPEDYQVDAWIHQLGRADVSPNGEQPSGASLPILRTYHFYNIFPTQVAPIEVSYETTDTIEEFTVELQVQWWEAGGNGGSVE